MKSNLSIGVIILTFNEEKHIERCINSVKSIASQIFVIDSFSTDKTIQIAEGLGAIVLQNKWENNHAKQLNWGLENTSFFTDWIFRIDADEIVTPELANELEQKLPLLTDEITGVVIPRHNFFMGKKIERGSGIVKILRLFRRNKAVCENKFMDEHMVLLEGDAVEFSNFMIDNNLNNLTWWTTKHNNYSIREMVDLLCNDYAISPNNDLGIEVTEDAKKKRKLKSKYSRMPLFWRAAGYFFYRYVLKGGFLEGREGFLWHFLQGFWYRILVDAKIYEIKKACGDDTEKMKKYIKENYNLEI